MELVSILKIAVLVVVGGLTIAAVVLLIFKEGFIEISPKRAIVVRNVWTSKARALMTTGLIMPGIEKKLMEVTLENEPFDPDIASSITADGTEVGVDFVIYTQQVVETAEAVIKAATVINYQKRRDLIIDRIKAMLQNYFSGIPIEDIFSKEAKKVNKALIEEAEKKVNEELERDVEKQWGIEVKIQIHNIKPPDKLLEVAEEAASAETEGNRILAKAKAAKVDPRWVIAGDILYDAARVLKGGKS